MRTPTQLERIQRLAYQLWEQDGRPEGRHLEHWQEAERQLEVEFRIGYPDGSSEDVPGETESAYSA